MAFEVVAHLSTSGFASTCSRPFGMTGHSRPSDIRDHHGDRRDRDRDRGYDRRGRNEEQDRDRRRYRSRSRSRGREGGDNRGRDASEVFRDSSSVFRDAPTAKVDYSDLKGRYL